MPTKALTSHLLSLASSPSYKAATTHPFLAQAGQGTLPLQALVHWLYQDRIYAAHAYPRFIGLLIAKIPFESKDLAGFGSDVTPLEARNRKILECLTFSLDNVSREVRFFEKTASRIELKGASTDIRIEREATRNYCAEMARVTSLGTLEDGLVFLWAMEKMYLDSWTFASKQTSQSSRGPLDEFIQNWTSADFIKFVEELENLVDMMDIQPGTDVWNRAEAVWNRVVELEVAFWPRDW
ncbi:TENA/THI-4 family protein [Ceratobasidium sp. AG-Ba]|nr:TENA/THI-4 family protein [Ceratobasidium sp. AG-Ba]